MYITINQRKSLHAVLNHYVSIQNHYSIELYSAWSQLWCDLMVLAEGSIAYSHLLSTHIKYVSLNSETYLCLRVLKWVSVGGNCLFRRYGRIKITQITANICSCYEFCGTILQVVSDTQDTGNFSVRLGLGMWQMGVYYLKIGVDSNLLELGKI